MPPPPEKRGFARTAPPAADASPVDATELHSEDLALVDAALGGDSRAAETLIGRLKCVPPILAARNRKLGRVLDEHELADLAQDTTILIWRKLGSYAGRASIETWVYRISCLELMNSFRKKLRRAPQTEGEEALPDVGAHDPPSRVDYEHVYASLERLGPPESDIVRLKHFEGLTFEEIGERLQISPNTAKTQYYRGLERLRGFLASQEEESP